MHLARLPILLAGLLALARLPVASGQATAVLVSGPDIGHRAPDFTLPWASKDGVGPIELPYQLRRDQGRIVVLAFFPRAFTAASTEQMRTFAQRYDELFG